MAAEFMTATKVKNVPEGSMVAVQVAGTRIALANVGGTLFAFDDTCTHEECSLADGDLTGTTVTCLCHGAEFDVRSGAVLAPPALVPVKVYRTRVEGDTVQVEV